MLSGGGTSVIIGTAATIHIIYYAESDSHYKGVIKRMLQSVAHTTNLVGKHLQDTRN